jgi:hypothetical protein
MPTATDLVTDLPADFEVFGQAVDTRLKALQPGTTLGDLAYSSATANTNTRLPIGTSGQVLAVSGGGVPAWTTTSDVTPLTTKGDLFTFTTVDARIGVGANGTVLTADSAEATGLKWATASSGLTWTLLNAGGTALTGAATITVSGISNKENIMVIVDSASSANAGAIIALRINTDTGSNYKNFGTALLGGSTYSANNITTHDDNPGTYHRFAKLSGSATSFAMGGAMITGGLSTGIKTIQSQGSATIGGNSDQRAYMLNGIYSGSAAITSISLFSDSGNFDAGTLFVYGA